MKGVQTQKTLSRTNARTTEKEVQFTNDSPTLPDEDENEIFSKPIIDPLSFKLQAEKTYKPLSSFSEDSLDTDRKIKKLLKKEQVKKKSYFDVLPLSRKREQQKRGDSIIVSNRMSVKKQSQLLSELKNRESRV